MNTSELEARLAGLLEKAPEEWSIVEYGDGDSLAIHSDDENRVCFMATHGGSRTAWERIQAHADLITEGKNALPALLQSLSTLRQRIEALEAVLPSCREIIARELRALLENCCLLDENLEPIRETFYDGPSDNLIQMEETLAAIDALIARQALGEG